VLFTERRSSRVKASNLGKWKRSDEDCEKYKAEADARGLKVEYLENKLEEKYHVENLFGTAEGRLRRAQEERSKASYEHMETRLMQKEEEIRKANIERDEVCLSVYDLRFSVRTSSSRGPSKRRSSKWLS
jgi:hypothetical protein